MSKVPPPPRLWRASKYLQCLRLYFFLKALQLVFGLEFDGGLYFHAEFFVYVYGLGHNLALLEFQNFSAADFRAFVEKVRAKLPETRICYMSLAPTRARWANVEKERKLNDLIKEYIDSHGNLDYIDTFDAMLGADGKPRDELFLKDRLHCNAAGYKVWAEIVRPHLK